MKAWKKPVVTTFTSEELLLHVKAAARSHMCPGMEFR